MFFIILMIIQWQMVLCISPGIFSDKIIRVMRGFFPVLPGLKLTLHIGIFIWIAANIVWQAKKIVHQLEIHTKTCLEVATCLPIIGFWQLFLSGFTKEKRFFIVRSLTILIMFLVHRNFLKNAPISIIVFLLESSQLHGVLF